MLTETLDYQNLIVQISEVYEQGRQKVFRVADRTLLETYWQIGQYIVEFEQKGSLKAQYGKALLENLSKDLVLKNGRGFSRSNLSYMRLLYQKYPICENLSHKLTWSHYCELVKIDDELERSFYEKQANLENWTLTKAKDELLVKYATYGMSSQLLIAKYQLYLPNEDELRKLIMEKTF